MRCFALNVLSPDWSRLDLHSAAKGVSGRPFAHFHLPFLLLLLCGILGEVMLVGEPGGHDPFGELRSVMGVSPLLTIIIIIINTSMGDAAADMPPSTAHHNEGAHIRITPGNGAELNPRILKHLVPGKQVRARRAQLDEAHGAHVVRAGRHAQAHHGHALEHLARQRVRRLEVVAPARARAVPAHLEPVEAPGRRLDPARGRRLGRVHQEHVFAGDGHGWWRGSALAGEGS